MKKDTQCRQYNAMLVAIPCHWFTVAFFAKTIKLAPIGCTRMQWQRAWLQGLQALAVAILFRMWLLHFCFFLVWLDHKNSSLSISFAHSDCLSRSLCMYFFRLLSVLLFGLLFLAILKHTHSHTPPFFKFLLVRNVSCFCCRN